MPSLSMTGSDSVKINNRILSDFADEDIASATFPNEIATVKTGKNGNSIYALNESGRQSEVVLRLIRGSGDDKFMNGILASQLNDFASFVLMQGELVKRVGDGKGNVTSDTYIMSGGIHTKPVEVKVNATGDTDQSVAVYTLKFANMPRTLG